MDNEPHQVGPLNDRQRAELVLRAGRHAELKLTIDVSSSGLLSIGALVSGILLSSAVIVRAALARTRR